MSDKVILRLQEVLKKTGLAKSSMYAKVAAGTFPKPIKLSLRSSGWIEHEVDAWIDERIVVRDGSAKHILDKVA